MTYLLVKVLKIKLSFKYSFTDTHAIANYNGFDDHTLSISYTENLPIGNFTISASETDKQYDEADSFVNSSITRDERSNTYTVSINGNLGQIARSSMPDLKMNNFFKIN